MENIKIIPYVAIDGIMSLPDSRVMALYDRMVEDGSHTVVFASGDIQNKFEFLEYMKRRGVLLYVLKVDGILAGVTWLDSLEKKTGFMHYCMFSNVWGRSDEIMREVVHQMIHMKDTRGEYIFDLFKGLVPAWNKRAVDFSVRCGGKILGTLPHAVWNYEQGKSEDAVFIYYTRGKIE
mgnify:CR=1 FL=1